MNRNIFDEQKPNPRPIPKPTPPERVPPTTYPERKGVPLPNKPIRPNKPPKK